MKDVHSLALQRIIDDMDDMEGKKMFEGGEPGGKGFSVEIMLSPQDSAKEELGEEGLDGDDLPADHDVSLHKGDHAEGELAEGDLKMAEGGLVPPEDEDADVLKLPPYLRKKRIGL